MKTKYPFNPDSYLGHRGPDELETVTGAWACGGSSCMHGSACASLLAC